MSKQTLCLSEEDGLDFSSGLFCQQPWDLVPTEQEIIYLTVKSVLLSLLLLRIKVISDVKCRGT